MTAHETAARKLLADWGSQPGGDETIVGFTRKLNDGGWYSPAYRDAIGQPHFRDWPPHQVAAFAWVHSHVASGRVAQIDIGLGHTPHRDQEREANTSALRDLPGPFVADVSMDQQCGDMDGLLRWTEPVVADIVVGREDNGEYRMGTTDIPVGEVALEIGSTHASRTALHLAQDGGVARWAYGHDALRVFIWMGEPLTFDLFPTLNQALPC